MKSDGYNETAAAAAYGLFRYPEAAAAAAGGRHKEEFGSTGARAGAVPVSPLGRAYG